MPGNPIALTLVGRVLLESSDTFEKARKAFNAALERDPDNVDARAGLAELEAKNESS